MGIVETYVVCSACPLGLVICFEGQRCLTWALKITYDFVLNSIIIIQTELQINTVTT